MSDEDKIEPKVWKLLKEAFPEGINREDAIKLIQSEVPWVKNTIICEWDRIIRENPSTIKKIGRGGDATIFLTKLSNAKFIDDEDRLDTHSTNKEDSSKNKKLDKPVKPDKLEKPYYEPFAKFLVKKKICSEATTTEGTLIWREWHNPDVIGFKKFKNKQARTAIITAEIKSVTTASEVIKGFGQSCAYKLFSHQVYLVVPNTIKGETEDRLLALCVQHNIGLVLFDPNKKAEDLEDEDWKIKNLPVSQDPNYAYVDLLGKKYSKGSENSKVIKLLDRYDII